MGDRSLIEWTDATWNPTTGCTKKSPGCKFCYAKRLFPKVYPGRAFEDVRVHVDRLDRPLRWRRPRHVFVNSMSDLFHALVPDAFIDQVFHVMARAPRHVFQILTKCPERMQDYISSALDGRLLQLGDGVAMRMREPLPNVWLGVSAEDQKRADERVPLLMRTPAAVRFLSLEPLIDTVDLGRWLCSHMEDGHWVNDSRRGSLVNWVIVGGESGGRAVRTMHPDWVRRVRDQCNAAGVPFFFKQWGHHKPLFAEGDLSLDLCDPPRNLSVKRGDFVCWAAVGKKKAGRTLDGRTWDERPTAIELQRGGGA